MRAFVEEEQLYNNGMTVKELISNLGKLDGSKEIRFFSFIEMGRGGSWIEVEGCDVEDEGGNYVLKICGSEDEDGGCD